MYAILITFVLSIFLIFIIYRFYSKLDSILKQYLPTQRVLNMKSNMKKVDKIEEETKKQQDSKIDDIFKKIREVAFMPIDFIQKATISFLSNIGLNLGKYN